jgi:hypothetical protein
MADEFKSVTPDASNPTNPTLDYAGPQKSRPVQRGSATFRMVICSIIAFIGVVMIACAATFSLPFRYEWIAKWGFFFVLISVAGLVVEYVRDWRSRDE